MTQNTIQIPEGCKAVSWEQKEEFNEKVKPLMKWLAENLHPHAKVIVERDRAELLKGSCSFVSDEFIVD